MCDDLRGKSLTGSDVWTAPAQFASLQSTVLVKEATWGGLMEFTASTHFQFTLCFMHAVLTCPLSASCSGYHACWVLPWLPTITPSGKVAKIKLDNLLLVMVFYPTIWMAWVNQEPDLADFLEECGRLWTKVLHAVRRAQRSVLIVATLLRAMKTVEAWQPRLTTTRGQCCGILAKKLGHLLPLHYELAWGKI